MDTITGRANKYMLLTIDAYGVAVKNGFKGTVDEWLASLKGEPFRYEDFTPEQLEELKGPKEVGLVTDRTTGKTYSLFVDNGKLMMEEGEGVGNNFSFIDLTTRSIYKLYVDNGNLMMEKEG